jgi:tetratricopeptide (TPR) repeat protein
VSAVDRIRTFLESRPTDRFGLYALALELRKAGRDDEALDVFDRLLEHHPGSGAGHYQRGLLLLDRGEVEEARRAWQEGLAALAGNDDPEARRSSSEIQGALRDLDP